MGDGEGDPDAAVGAVVADCVAARGGAGRRWSLAKTTVVPSLAVVIVVLVGSVAFSVQGFQQAGKREWVLAGGVEATAAAFRVSGMDGTSREFTLSTSVNTSDLTSVVLQSRLDFIGKYDVKAINVEDLSPATNYHYVLRNGATSVWQGSFSTPQVPGTAAEFTTAIIGCAQTGSKHRVFNDIANQDPQLLVHTGDLHYGDVIHGDANERIKVLDKVMGSPAMAALFSAAPLAYMWDDHDFCGNNMNSECPALGEARISYQKGFPHYKLAMAQVSNSSAADIDSEDIAPYQAFTFGSVRFVLTDLRSEASIGRRAMSLEQQAWLKEELRRADEFDFIVWVSTKPWTGVAAEGSDHWNGWHEERRDLSNFISEHIGKRKRNLLMVTSDAHMVAFDDGSHTDFSEDQDAGFPVLVSGPLHNVGTTLGGPYSHGCKTLRGEVIHQFSTLTFSSTEGTPCVNITSFRRGEELAPIFSQKLCGDIFKPLGAPPIQGSCENQVFQQVTWNVLVSVVFITVLFAVLALRLYHRAEALRGLRALVMAQLAVLFGGIGVPLLLYLVLRNFQFDTLAVAYVLLYLTLQNTVILVCKAALRHREIAKKVP